MDKHFSVPKKTLIVALDALIYAHNDLSASLEKKVAKEIAAILGADCPEYLADKVKKL